MSFRIVPLLKGTAPAIALYRPVLLIGRHVECDVRLDSPKVSRRHCCVATAYDRVLIRDLGSRNGVRVNGRLLDESRLFPGDELAIGPMLFRLEQEEQPQLSPRPSVPPPSVRATPVAKRPPAVAPAASSARAPDSEMDLVPIDDI